MLATVVIGIINILGLFMSITILAIYPLSLSKMSYFICLTFFNIGTIVVFRELRCNKTKILKLVYEIQRLDKDIGGSTPGVIWIIRIFIVALMLFNPAGCIINLLEYTFNTSGLENFPINYRIVQTINGMTAVSIYLMTNTLYLVIGLVIIKSLHGFCIMTISGMQNSFRYSVSKHRDHAHPWETPQNQGTSGNLNIPEWMTLHQRLCFVVRSMNEVFAHLLALWSCIELVNICFVIRALDLTALIPAIWKLKIALIVSAVYLAWSFIVKFVCGAIINCQVRITFVYFLLCTTSIRGQFAI